LAVGERRVSALVGTAALGASTGLMALLQLDYLVIACRDILEWLVLGSLNLLGIFTILAIPIVVAQKNTGLIHNSKNFIQWSLFCFVVGAAVTGLFLMPKAYLLQPITHVVPALSGFFYNLDGRYRDFPLAIYLLPVLQLTIGLWLLQLRSLTIMKAKLYRYLNITAFVTMAVFLLSEPLNIQAYLWMSLVILLSIASWPMKENN
jgi:hypothetical protein